MLIFIFIAILIIGLIALGFVMITNIFAIMPLTGYYILVKGMDGEAAQNAAEVVTSQGFGGMIKLAIIALIIIGVCLIAGAYGRLGLYLTICNFIFEAILESTDDRRLFIIILGELLCIIISVVASFVLNGNLGAALGGVYKIFGTIVGGVVGFFGMYGVILISIFFNYQSANEKLMVIISLIVSAIFTVISFGILWFADLIAG